jgi:hypothetical protein
LVNLPPGETEGVKGLCLEPHDLAIAKYAAAREKDRIFTHELARRGMVSEERLLSLLEQTPVDGELRERMRGYIARDFHAERAVGRQAGAKSPSSDLTRKRDTSKHSELQRDSGKSLDDDASE